MYTAQSLQYIQYIYTVYTRHHAIFFQFLLCLHNHISCVSDVDVSREKIYFAFKTDTTSELRSVSLGAAEEIFDRSVEKQIDDEIINGSP